MPGKPEPQTELFALRPIYLIGELVRLAHVSTTLMARLLEPSRVTYVRVGRICFVPQSEIQQMIPTVWKSLCFAAKARTTAEREPRAVQGASRLASSGNPLALRGIRS
jgi:hypothetical protein